MSATNHQLGQLSAKYARTFGIDQSLVEYEKWDDGEGKVWADGYPVWTPSKSENEYFSGDARAGARGQELPGV